jgi:hypothetical protein
VIHLNWDLSVFSEGNCEIMCLSACVVLVWYMSYL